MTNTKVIMADTRVVVTDTKGAVADTEDFEALLEWEASLETGMALIDEQHHTLIDQIKILADRSHPERIPDTLRFLENYVVEHFGTEEHLHAEAHCPEAEAHMDTHNAFIQTFQDFKREYAANGEQQRLLMLLKLTKLLSVWLKEHITGMDRRFAQYYLAEFPGASGSAGKLPSDAATRLLLRRAGCGTDGIERASKAASGA